AELRHKACEVVAAACQDLVVHLPGGSHNGAQDLGPESVVKRYRGCRGRCRRGHDRSPGRSVSLRSTSSSTRRWSPGAISPSVSTWANKVVPVKAAQAFCCAGWGDIQVRCGAANPYKVT